MRYVVAKWIDDGGYYEAFLPSGVRITSREQGEHGTLGDVWEMDVDGRIDQRKLASGEEFDGANIELSGGPRDGHVVA